MFQADNWSFPKLQSSKHNEYLWVWDCLLVKAINFKTSPCCDGHRFPRRSIESNNFVSTLINDIDYNDIVAIYNTYTLLNQLVSVLKILNFAVFVVFCSFLQIDWLIMESSSMNEVRWREQLDSWHSLHGWSAQILAESASLVIREPPSSWWSPWESKQRQTRLCYQFQPNSNKKKVFVRNKICFAHFWISTLLPDKFIYIMSL